MQIMEKDIIITEEIDQNDRDEYNRGYDKRNDGDESNRGYDKRK